MFLVVALCFCQLFVFLYFLSFQVFVKSTNMASLENKSSVSENGGAITDMADQASLMREDCDPNRGVVVQTFRSDTDGLADTHNSERSVNESKENEMAQERLVGLLKKIGGRPVTTPARLMFGGHSEMTPARSTFSPGGGSTREPHAMTVKDFELSDQGTAAFLKFPVTTT